MARKSLNPRKSLSKGKNRYSHPGIRKPHLSTGRKMAIRAMLDHGMSGNQIAIMEGVSTSTIYSIRDDKNLTDLNPKYVEKTRQLLASRFYVLADKAIEKAQEEDRIDKMNSYQLTMMGAVSVDKARLMDGMSTENVSVRTLNDQVNNSRNELESLKAAIMAKLDGKVDFKALESANYPESPTITPTRNVEMIGKPLNNNESTTETTSEKV